MNDEVIAFSFNLHLSHDDMHFSLENQLSICLHSTDYEPCLIHFGIQIDRG